MGCGILACAEIVEDLVALRDHVHPVTHIAVEACKLINPPGLVVLCFEFFEELGAFFQVDALLLVNFVLEYIATGIARRKTDIFFQIFDRADKLAEADRQLTEGIDNLLVIRIPVVCEQHDVSALLELFGNLIEVADLA